MIVCSCNALTDADVRRVAGEAQHRPWVVHRCLGCRPKCGTCLPTIAGLLEELLPAGSLAAEAAARCAVCPLAHDHAGAHAAAAADLEPALLVAAE